MDLEAIWPGWETVGTIGTGSFGAVYEIRRTVRGRTESAALKVIRIPKERDEIEKLRADDYDDESITQYFTDCHAKIMEEYSIMASLKGYSNIVYCDEIRSIQHDDGFGWDIYIKMELLTPLKKYLGSEIREDQVIALGIDICNALTHCEELQIVHRDIKPGNILVSKDGRFKLGDFGIAKTMDGTARGTMAGTPDYMAPEVNNYGNYHTDVDIYSLGLVLYRMLNEFTGPFLVPNEKKPTASMMEEARFRRFSGEPLPAPKHGSDALTRVVLKACAFRPEDRYRSAKEMLAALQKLNGLEEYETTRTIYAPTQSKPIYNDQDAPTVGSVITSKKTENLQERPKKKMNVSVIVVACAIVALAISLAMGHKSKEPDASKEPVQSVQTVLTEQNQVKPDVQSQAKLPATETKKEQSITINLPTIPTRETQPPKKPSVDDVKPFGDVITYPQSSSYLNSYETKYVKAPKGNSIYVFWNYNGGVSDSRRKFNLYEGDEVTVLARQGTRSCVIFKDKNGKKQIGWVNSDYLVSEY